MAEVGYAQEASIAGSAMTSVAGERPEQLLAEFEKRREIIRAEIADLDHRLGEARIVEVGLAQAIEAMSEQLSVKRVEPHR